MSTNATIDPPRLAAARKLRGARGTATTVAFACLAVFVSYLPLSTANGVLGTIAAHTGAATSDLQWIADAYTVALAASVLSAGVLGDLFGRRRVALAGLSLTALGAATGFAAGWLHGLAAVHLLWVGQAIAGAGAGAVLAATIGLLAAAAPDAAARARFIGVWVAGVLGGLAAGPFLASPIVTNTDWRWVFAPILALALAVATFGAVRSLEFSAPDGRRLDAAGQTTGALAIAALSFGVIHGGAHGFGSTLALIPIVAAAALAAFVAVERRAVAPLLSPRLFASGGFSASALASMGVLFTTSGALFVLSLLFAHQRVDEIGIALRLGCLLAGALLASLAASQLTGRLGARVVMVSGLALAAVGSATLLTVDSATGLGGFAWRLVIIGLGNGLVLATAAEVAVESVPAPLAGMAGAASLALRQLGGALGPAVLGALLTGRLHTGDDFIEAVRLCAAVIAAVFALIALITAALFTRRSRPA